MSLNDVVLGVASISSREHWLLLFISIFLGCTCYLLGLGIYNVYFHPLRAFPGPKLYAASRLPYVRSTLTGHMAHTLRELHATYGPVVRTAPNELSFIESSAWKTIYSQRHGDHAKYKKNYETFHQSKSDLSYSLFVANDADHLRMRRVLTHAFSERALKEQEPLIQSHVATLIRRLHEKVDVTEGRVDLVEWYNWTAFDIIADLSFGKPFNCLNNSEFHPWVVLISKAWKTFTFVGACKSLSPSDMLLDLLVPKSLIQKQFDHFNVVLDQVRKRLASNTERPDFVSSIVKNNKEDDLSTTEILSNASLLVAAGTETIATLLPAVTYLLLRNPEVMARATAEIREAFTEETALCIHNVNQLKYLSAVIDEALRLFPPVPEGLPRVTPVEGDTICGRWVPGGTFVQISPFAANLSSANFSQPESFIPERWLNRDSRFVSDDKSVLQPFSTGPRNCIGQNLALAEVRLVIACVLWSFDMELCDENDDWMNQRTYMLWEKKPLMVRLTPAKHV